MAFTAFIISLLLAVDAMEPTGPWLVTITVLTGLEALRPRLWWSLSIRDVWFAVGLAAFIIALLLTAGRLETSDEGWLIALAALTGVLAFVPRRLRSWRRRRWSRAWAGADWPDGEDW